MTIVLTLATVDGTQELAEFEDNVTMINLELRRMIDIDLSPLASCINLQRVSLHGNQLQSVDLTPFASCSNLQELGLSGNHLKTIDLSPLATCTSLRAVSLDYNQLWSIDLAPLAACAGLQGLRLGKNQLQNIDLTALETCTNLLELSLDYNQLQTIDLSALSACTGLRKLELNGNHLQSIDLNPLSYCTSFWELELSENVIHSIDLGPLSYCTRFGRLWLHANRLHYIDLNPLASCTSLQKLGLNENYLHSIDLRPLASCTSLQTLWLNANRLQSVDLTPLSQCTNLEELALFRNPFHSEAPYSWLEKDKVSERPKDSYPWFVALGDYNMVYERPKDSYSWHFLHQVARKNRNNCQVQQDILYAMGLKDYGFIDSNLSGLFLSFSSDASTEMVHQQVKERLLAEIVRAVDQERTSTGLRIEELSSQHSAIAKIAHRIINLREAEMHLVRVGAEGDEVDLREVWLTAYGYMVLTSLGMGLTTDLEGVEQVSTALTELGFDLKTSTTSRSGVKMSNELRQTILWIAKYSGRPWYRIEMDRNKPWSEIEKQRE